MSHAASPGPNLSIRCQAPNYVPHRETGRSGYPWSFRLPARQLWPVPRCRGAHAVATFKVRSRISWLAWAGIGPRLAQDGHATLPTEPPLCAVQ